MANTLIINGVIIDENESPRVSGAAITSVTANGTNMWNRFEYPNPMTFTASGTFKVPAGVSSVDICMCGGGGSGSSSDGYGGGGYRGEIVNTTVNGLSEGEEVSITIGSGGSGVNGSPATGHSGGSTSFGSYSSANGGSGGNYHGANYGGEGGSFASPCGGTRYDGSSGGDVQFGGQAGAFGNGGNGETISPGGGGVGAGGGSSYINHTSGSGGRGQCVISWTPFNASWSGSSIAAYSTPYEINTSGSAYRAKSDGNVGIWLYSTASNPLDTGQSSATFTFGQDLQLDSVAPNTMRAGGNLEYGEFLSYEKGVGFSGQSVANGYTGSPTFATSGGLVRAEFQGEVGDWISLT